MANNQYVLIQKPVEAMQYDGTTARAYEILAWVHRNGGTGRLSEDEYPNDTYSLYVQNTVSPVLESEWVVMTGRNFSKMTNDYFCDNYEGAPV